MNKGLAINLLSRKGCKITNDITFASKNSTANTYWANPNESYIKKNWTLILNDTIKKTLHLFYIPANSIKGSLVRYRLDKDVLDIQIDYYDINFTDTRSGIRFNQYKICELQY
jgi:hypothetical protein